jgi:hypothetical protein
MHRHKHWLFSRRQSDAAWACSSWERRGYRNNSDTTVSIDFGAVMTSCVMSVAAWKSPNSQLEPKQANQRHGRNADRNPLVFESASHNPSNNNSVNRLRPNFATPANSGVHNPRSQGSPSSQHESTHKSTNFKHRSRIKLIPDKTHSTGVVSAEDH